MSSVVGNGSSTTVALKIQPSATKKFSLCGCCRPPNRRAKFIEEVDGVYLPNGAAPNGHSQPSSSIWHSQTKQQNGFSKHNTTAVQPTTTKVESITLTSCPLAPSTSKTSTEINSSKGRLRNNSDVEYGSLAGFETARTSRHEETSRYISMAQLVGKIREEAGLVDTPRPAPLTPTIDSNGVNELTNSTSAVSTQIKNFEWKIW
uniref:Uncharacterized protein n=1 Tax=Ditylenchus dipsaci TaxID=166011 RepID=A0A915DWN4_9BILA